MTARYAVFFSPHHASALADFGKCALHRDSVGMPVASSSSGYHDTETAKRLSATPAHYGFHATLKAPFSLRAGTTESLLLSEVESLASTCKPISLESLYPRTLDGFAALTLDPDSTAVNQLADQCVDRFETFRAPLGESDIARRLKANLSETQREYLLQYGYPFVKGEFRFHMTLTGKLNLASDAPYTQWLEKQFKQRVRGVPELDRLAVFHQPDRESAFTQLAEFEFSSAT